MKALLTIFFAFLFISMAAQSSWAKSGGYLPKNLFIKLAKKINPTVVSIFTSSHRRTHQKQFQQDPFFDIFEKFLDPQMKIPKQRLGTGFIIRKDGLIITNNHVVSGADTISVQLSGSKKIYEARVIGKDQRTDIALIKIQTEKALPIATLGTSKKLQVGEWVAAFGNPYGHTHSMSKGIISALGREITELNRFAFIQTDASINPGNSGGPLVNAKGQVIGVNTAIDARAQGIGFAIPIDDVKEIIPRLEKDGLLRRGFLGLHLENIFGPAAKALNLPTTRGALITKVLPKAPAKKAGLMAYDFITHFNHKRVSNSRNLVESISRASANQKVNIQFIRNGKKNTQTIKLGSHPADEKKIASQRRRRSTKKVYSGQKAPFNLGFYVKNYNRQLQQFFALPLLQRPQPVVLRVNPTSPAAKAGLSPGDIILDVNKTPVYQANTLLKALRKSQINVLRILRRSRVLLLYLDSD